ncbi:helix-turn-helix domain-containing protein [Streptomyces laurentii]|uniref:helix-turn-helix domain-containing protein n=1 Tax=Streptomyces laurentii TaxID=39478 RepID=UPI0036CA4A4E
MIEGVDEAAEPVNAAAYFGNETKTLREFLGLSQVKFADELHYRQAQVSKVESGTVLASDAFASAMDRVAGTPGVYGRLRTKLSKVGNPEWFVPYLRLERKAAQVLDFSPFLIMGILQTPEYAEALFRAAHPRDTTDTVREKVALRLQRREVLERSNPPLLWVVLDEGCLRREVGGRAVMRGQLEHLSQVAEAPSITIQVLPFGSGAPAAAEGFTLLTFGDDNDQRPVLYSEAQGMGRVIDLAGIVATGTERYDRLRADALSPEKSLRALREATKEYTQ